MPVASSIRLAWSRELPHAARGRVAVFFVWAGEPTRAEGLAASLADAWILRYRFKGLPGDVAQFPTWNAAPCEQVIVAGLGARSEFHIGVLRRAVGAAVRRALRSDAREIVVSWNALNGLPSHPPEELARALGAAAVRAAPGLRKDDGHRRSAATMIHVHARLPAAVSRRCASALREGGLIGEAVNEVRALANLPGNEAPPEVIAAFARRLARRHGMRYEVWDRRRLLRERCGALLAVAQGSRREPRLILLSVAGRNTKAPPIVLVGKTITFDTGGISIKPARNMEWMRYDKSGGMAVLAALAIAARPKPARPVIGILAAAENMPGGNATRPGDVVRSRAGKTIEIINTDAEGRLVLADALSVALDHHRPAAIMDLATLTGAAVTALGHVVSAVMGTAGEVDRALRAGERTGERVWPLPLYREYREMLKTPFADIKNTGDGTAGAIAGGMFLSSFVPAGTRWVHVDLTNAWEEKEQPYAAAGANLFGAELAWAWLTSFDRQPGEAS